MVTFGTVFRAGVAVLALGLTAGAARADDGIFSFFQHAFGGAEQSAPQSGSDNPGYSYDAPPLTVRRRPGRRHYAAPARTPQEVLADSKGVTLYTDKTLERGDVVMTEHGLRVFNGSSSWPHTDDDFVDVASASRIAPDMRKQLHSIDVASKIAAGY